jgi:flagellar hook protein FlgE
MSFNTGLSGLNAASTDLNVTSNNIANSNTTGFKSSRTEFADVFSLSALGVGSTAVGSGVLANKVAQQFSQGNLNFTESTLDLAISGQGFFCHE